jgi:hypothetical protein
MTSRMECICPSSSVQEAERDVCSIVVIHDRDRKVLGLITERDKVRNVCIYNNVSINSVSSPLIITKSNSAPEGNWFTY